MKRACLFAVFLFPLNQRRNQTLASPMNVPSRFFLFIALSATCLHAETVVKRELNDGQLILEDIPEIPQEIVEDLRRYQNVRSAAFLAWTPDSKSVYVSTRFGDVSQIHRVDQPGGARTQLTFFDEPIGSVSRRPGAPSMAFTMDAGGSEFAQIYLLDPQTGESRLLTDGESRNGSLEWSRDGKYLAFRSTRRNGRSNDLWELDPDQPNSARLLLESPDGSSWAPIEWSPGNGSVLVNQYISIRDSRIHLIDRENGERARLEGASGEGSSVNYAVGFDASGDGLFFITNQKSDFNQLAFRRLDSEDIRVITEDIAWNVDRATMSDQKDRMAFVVNEDGLGVLYLMDTQSMAFKKVAGLPTGLVGGLGFSPDGRKLALTLNTAQSPSDTFVLTLGEAPSEVGQLERWTTSEIGGLDASTFVSPKLIRYRTFDDREIPAFVYQPPGDGPFPVVVSIHGGPESQFRPAFSSTFQLWVQKLGVAVIAPNVRGSSGYGNEYVNLDNGFRREDSVKDIGALLDWIGTQKSLDADRVAVYGGSYGGYMVLASTTFYSDRLKAAVDIVGISNFVTFLENTQDYRRDLRRVEYGDERDLEMRAFLEKISPNNRVEKIGVPMLVIQGQNDPRVPVTEAEQIVSSLRKNGKTVWYMNALNEGHGYRKKANRDVYQQVVTLFLNQYLSR